MEEGKGRGGRGKEEGEGREGQGGRDAANFCLWSPHPRGRIVHRLRQIPVSVGEMGLGWQGAHCLPLLPIQLSCRHALAHSLLRAGMKEGRGSGFVLSVKCRRAV